MFKEKDQSWTHFILETALLILLVLGVRFYVFQFFRVSGPSMCPTLNMLNDECSFEEGSGEFIFVNEFLYNFIRPPQFGEIAVFHPPNEDVFYIKRVLGTPGDTLEIQDGVLYLTNENVTRMKLDETYLSDLNKGQTQTFGQNIFHVPEGHYLFFGDNRNHSFDARRCYNAPYGCDGSKSPFVPLKNIQGKASFVVWPISSWRDIKNEYEFLFTP